MNIESTIIQSVTTDLIDAADIPPLIVDEDNAYESDYTPHLSWDLVQGTRRKMKK